MCGDCAAVEEFRDAECVFLRDDHTCIYSIVKVYTVPGGTWNNLSLLGEGFRVRDSGGWSG